MKSIFSKILSLIILVILFIPIYIIFFIYSKIKNIDIFEKKRIYIYDSLSNIYYFNSKSYFISTIPLFFYVLIGKLDIVGVSFRDSFSKEFSKYRSGVFNLVQVYKNSKILFHSIDDIDREYISNRTFKKDLAIILKTIFTSIYYHNSFDYQKKVTLFNIEFENITMKEAINLISSFIENRTQKTIFFMNPDCFNKTFSDKKYLSNIKKSDYIFPDGSGVNLACKILNTPLKENINGTDMLPFIVKESIAKGFTIFLLGGKKGVANIMKSNLESKFPTVKIVGLHHGYFRHNNLEENIEVLDKINSSKANILFVAFGAPLQEEWIIKNRDSISSSVIFGVGGLFDFYSNQMPRAPKWLREIGLEWTYRLKQEPKRMWKRYILGNPIFLYRVYFYKIFNR